TFPDNEPFNLAQAGGATLLTGNGVTGTGSPRVTIASDNTAFSVNVGTFPDNEPFNVAQINGVAVTMGNGISGTGVQRVTLASDSTGQVAIASLPNEGQQTAANSISVTLPSNLASCLDDAQVTSVVIETSVDAQLVALSGSTIIYVCGFNFIAAGTVNVRLVSGTGSVCATGLTARTGTYQLTAQVGIAIPNGGGVQFKTAAGEALCIDVSAAIVASGFVTYVQR
ncbi:MAG: hypothetical protein Q8S13_04580, partial [Dehalococcoidia bacterium]|nr:hypothetical protein [Dehalococcoidia bacterium]